MTMNAHVLHTVPSRASRSLAVGLVLLPLLWLCGGQLLILPYHGGSGLNFPSNLLAWGVMALLALWCTLGDTRSRTGDSFIQGGLITGVFLWSLPLLWTPHWDWFLNALPRVVALWGLAGLYSLLMSTRPAPRVRQAWLVTLVLAALIQACCSMVQFTQHHGPYAWRPHGGFIQANVLGSFLATGLACALYLVLFARGRRSRMLALLALLILPASLVLTQSRAGDLGAAMALSLLLWQGYRKRCALRFPVALLLVGTALGGLWLYGGNLCFPDYVPAPVGKGGSNAARLYMLKLTWQLIMQHPLVGNGYGGFEALFGQLAAVNPPGLEAATVTHPHNELLYAWLEGGLLALAGLLLMVAAVLVRMWRRDGMRLAGLALVLPLAVHSLLEFPLYLSVTHGLVMVMLLVISGPYEPASSLCDGGQGPVQALLTQSLPAVLALLALTYMGTGLVSQQRLMRMEQLNLLPLIANAPQTPASLLNPSALAPRLDFDRHVALLLRFNQTRDQALLNAFRAWGGRFLQTHNDPKVYASLLMIARAQQLPEAVILCHQAHGRWPADPRFACPDLMMAPDTYRPALMDR